MNPNNNMSHYTFSYFSVHDTPRPRQRQAYPESSQSQQQQAYQNVAEQSKAVAYNNLLGLDQAYNPFVKYSLDQSLLLDRSETTRSIDRLQPSHWQVRRDLPTHSRNESSSAFAPHESPFTSWDSIFFSDPELDPFNLEVNKPHTYIPRVYQKSSKVARNPLNPQPRAEEPLPYSYPINIPFASATSVPTMYVPFNLQAFREEQARLSNARDAKHPTSIPMANHQTDYFNKKRNRGEAHENIENSSQPMESTSLYSYPASLSPNHAGSGLQQTYHHHHHHHHHQVHQQQQAATSTPTTMYNFNQGNADYFREAHTLHRPLAMPQETELFNLWNHQPPIVLETISSNSGSNLLDPRFALSSSSRFNNDFEENPHLYPSSSNQSQPPYCTSSDEMASSPDSQDSEFNSCAEEQQLQEPAPKRRSPRLHQRDQQPEATYTARQARVLSSLVERHSDNMKRVNDTIVEAIAQPHHTASMKKWQGIALAKFNEGREHKYCAYHAVAASARSKEDLFTLHAETATCAACLAQYSNNVSQWT